MEYKIEYTPVFIKKDLTVQKIRRFSVIAMLAGILLSSILLCMNREPISQAVDTLERMVLQVGDFESVVDVIGAFCQTLQGDFGG